MSEPDVICSSAFDAPLLAHGFRLDSAKVTEDSTCRIYRRGDLTIVVDLNLFYYDLPWASCRVLFSERMEDCDRRSLPLWRLVEELGGQHDYGIDRVEDAPEAVQRAADDLMHYGRDFLRGDLTSFRPLREKFNQEQDQAELDYEAKERFRDAERNRAKAQAAFRSGDYQSVLAALEEIDRSLLTAADLKRTEMARKRLSEA